MNSGRAVTVVEVTAAIPPGSWRPPRLADLLGDDAPRSGLLEGPWLQAFFTELPGEMRSKSNARRYRARRVTARERWSAYRDYESGVAAWIADAVPEGWELGPPPPAALRARPTVASFVFARTALDAANLPKSVLDAAQGIVYWTDASVRYSSELADRSRSADGGLVAFARLAPGTGSNELLVAGAALAAACSDYLEPTTRALD